MDNKSNFFVLIVDDDLQNLKVLGQMLKEQGYQIALADSGENALSIIKNTNPDLILLDVMMPIMDGFEVCRQIRLIPNKSSIPVIFLSALTDVDKIVEGLSYGAVDFLVKPFNARLLLAKLKLHIDLKNKTTDLEELNKNLESKVAERTIELEKANALLSQINNLKSEFLTIISHEIRTPLNGIMGATQLIKHIGYDEKLEAFIEMLDISVKRLERFAINALHITNLKAGNYRLRITKVNISQLINKILLEFEKSISEKGLKIAINVHDDLEIDGEYELVKICINSVIDNAIKFSNEYGTIVLELKNDEQQISFSVIDSGSGFSEKALHSLFNVFSPGDTFINENEGIELALSKLIMDVHKGSIEVKNLPSGAEVLLKFNKSWTIVY